MWRHWLPLALSALAFTACDPYDRFTGDSSAGAVNAIKFPAAYLGDSGDGKKPGMGVMTPTVVRVGGVITAYYSFPFTQIDDSGMPILALTDDKGKNAASLAYAFDADGKSKCVPPDGYQFDQQRDDVRYDQQGSIFDTLPDADGYSPAVAQVDVHSNGLPCQDVKSEAKLVERTDVTLALTPPENPNEVGAHATGTPSGKYYARVIIDPSVDVRGPVGYFGYDNTQDPPTPYEVDPATGLGPQKWGWYQRYLLAYLDGGEIPVFTQMTPDKDGNPQNVTSMVTQNLYFPTSHVKDPNAKTKTVVMGARGDGFDLMDAMPGQAGFSPLCIVYSFDPIDPLHVETTVAQIDMATATPTGDVVWCIQVTK
jgi:hypothetical protein